MSFSDDASRLCSHADDLLADRRTGSDRRQADRGTPERRKEPRRLPKFECPRCHEWDTEVKEGRPHHQGYRRIRACVRCGFRFTTMERAA